MDVLQRLRELVIQAANGTNAANDLTAIQTEIDSNQEGRPGRLRDRAPLPRDVGGHRRANASSTSRSAPTEATQSASTTTACARP